MAILLNFALADENEAADSEIEGTTVPGGHFRLSGRTLVVKHGGLYIWAAESGIAACE